MHQRQEKAICISGMKNIRCLTQFSSVFLITKGETKSSSNKPCYQDQAACRGIEANWVDDAVGVLVILHKNSNLLAQSCSFCVFVAQHYSFFCLLTFNFASSHNIVEIYLVI